jgi:hypothetical protein
MELCNPYRGSPYLRAFYTSWNHDCSCLCRRNLIKSVTSLRYKHVKHSFATTICVKVETGLRIFTTTFNINFYQNLWNGSHTHRQSASHKHIADRPLYFNCMPTMQNNINRI